MSTRFMELFPDSESFLGHRACYQDKVVSDGMTKADRHFRYVVSDVFHHHATGDRPARKDRIDPSPEGAIRLVRRDVITAMFRESFMSEFRISATPNEMEEDIADRMVSFDDFCEQITVPSAQAGQTDPGSNYLSFVTGEVGHGKSLLMMKLLDTIEKKMARALEGAALPAHLYRSRSRLGTSRGRVQGYRCLVPSNDLCESAGRRRPARSAALGILQASWLGAGFGQPRHLA